MYVEAENIMDKVCDIVSCSSVAATKMMRYMIILAKTHTQTNGSML